jgi:hypothetical protein
MQDINAYTVKRDTTNHPTQPGAIFNGRAKRRKPHPINYIGAAGQHSENIFNRIQTTKAINKTIIEREISATKTGNKSESNFETITSNCFNLSGLRS